MATRTLTVNLIGRADKLNRSFKNASRGADTMAGKMMKATRMAGIGFTALGGVAVGAAMALKPMIDKAAEVEESLSKNTVVFGENAKAVEQFAERSLQAYGVTRREALEATGVIGALGSAMGMAEADSAAMATTLVGLAGDMSSFNNASVEETLTAIQAGLRGENEPLRRFGVLLDAVTLKNKALEKGIIKNTKEALTPQAKALAAYAVILEQTEIQMGDFERTADSATNQSKLLAGEWDKITTEIGTALLPAFTAIVTHLNEEVLPAVRQFWSDPSWYEGGVLAAKVAGSGFIETLTGAGGIGGLTKEEIDDLGFWESWKASAELNAIATGIAYVRDFIRGAKDEANRQPVGPVGFTMDPGQRGEMPAALAGVVVGPSAAGAAYSSAGAAASGELGAAAGWMTAMIREAMEDAAAASEAAAALSEAMLSPAEEHKGGAFADAAAAAAAPGPSEGQLSAEVEAWLKTPGAQSLLGGPIQTVVNINSTAVSGQEVVDALGAFVDTNGPLPPHWQQSAQ